MIIDLISLYTLRAVDLEWISIFYHFLPQILDFWKISYHTPL